MLIKVLSLKKFGHALDFQLNKKLWMGQISVYFQVSAVAVEWLLV